MQRSPLLRSTATQSVVFICKSPWKTKTLVFPSDHPNINIKVKSRLCLYDKCKTATNHVGITWKEGQNGTTQSVTLNTNKKTWRSGLEIRKNPKTRCAACGTNILTLLTIVRRSRRFDSISALSFKSNEAATGERQHMPLKTLLFKIFKEQKQQSNVVLSSVCARLKSQALIESACVFSSY